MHTLVLSNTNLCAIMRTVCPHRHESGHPEQSRASQDGAILDYCTLAGRVVNLSGERASALR